MSSGKGLKVSRGKNVHRQGFKGVVNVSQHKRAEDKKKGII